MAVRPAAAAAVEDRSATIQYQIQASAVLALTASEPEALEGRVRTVGLHLPQAAAAAQEGQVAQRRHLGTSRLSCPNMRQKQTEAPVVVAHGATDR